MSLSNILGLASRCVRARATRPRSLLRRGTGALFPGTVAVFAALSLWIAHLEVIQNTMGGFFVRRDSEGEERWWLEITGKGEKTRLVPATAELMIELARYRRENGLSPLPVPGEPTPLLLPIGGKQRPLTRSAVHLVVKEVFARTAARMRERGPESERLANLVEDASAHWMRHTAGSSMADSMDLRNVRDNLGHSSISTTNSYLHTEDDQRHRETEAKHRLGW